MKKILMRLMMGVVLLIASGIMAPDVTSVQADEGAGETSHDDRGQECAEEGG